MSTNWVLAFARALAEMVPNRLMMMLAELLVLTDFGVCLLVELACCLSHLGLLVDCLERITAMCSFDIIERLACLIQWVIVIRG